MNVRDFPSLLPLKLEQVVFAAGGRRIIDGISLELGPGARTVIIGPNGAGKSVLLRLCHGLLHPTSGTIRWSSREPSRGPKRQAMVFQRPVLLRRSVIGNVIHALGVAGVPRVHRIPRAQDALRRVGLARAAKHPARALSGGEQQRLALARACALAPQILFLDEPTANLDPNATQEIERIIAAMHEGGTKIVLVTHNLGQARRLGDEILFIHQGQLAERAPADRFFRRPLSREAAKFLAGELPW